MSREIKFRGKRISNGEGWVYGSLLKRIGCYPSIIVTYPTNDWNVDYREISVYKETVEQFTGLYDKNNNEVYEGDILEVVGKGDNKGKTFRREVTFHGGAFSLFCKELSCHNPLRNHIIDGRTNWYIVGNIHDNPELLK